MRRFLIALTLLTPWGLAGCEDGPDQPYEPAPANAANNWNNGNTPGFTDPSKQTYDGGNTSSGTNKQEICTAPKKAERWKAMVQEPIIPPHGGGGIDLAGGDTWQGITIEEAEQINCQSNEYGEIWGGVPANYWGDNAEVMFMYNASTRKGFSMMFNPGYVGTLDSKSREHEDPANPGTMIQDEFKIHLYASITKNGAVWPIDWFAGAFVDEVNELGSALMATYAPFLPVDTTANCYSTGMCVVGTFGNIAYIWVPVIGAAIWTPNSQATGASNIIDRVDVDLSKIMPFALAYPRFKLDAEGPTASPLDVLNVNKGQPCVLKFGLDFQEFLDNCVMVTGDATKDATEKNKLFGGFLHGREQYHFDLNGVDIDFAPANLPEDKIISDQDRPTAGDHAHEFTVDQSIMGKFINDRYKNDPKGPRDNHAMGLIWMEYARIVQAEINKFLASKGEPTHELGDPDCLEPNVDPASDTYPNGCSGMEGFVTCAPRGSTPDPLLDKLSQGFDQKLNGGSGYPACGYLNSNMQNGIKPGHPSSMFCTDPVVDPKINENTGLATVGFKNCITGDIWSTSFSRVLHVFGHDKLDNMPYEIRDHRFFFHAFMKAFVKYLIAAGNGQETIEGVHNAKYNPDDLHYDSAGAGQWETAAYVDRRFVTQELAPIEFTLDADIKNGILSDYQFVSQLYRGEKLIYTAVQEDKTKALGALSTAQLTNIFGSPVLKNGYHSTSYRTAYECATADPPLDAKLCDGQTPPMDPKNPSEIERDEDGLPILIHYKGAFEGNASAFALRAASPIKVTKVQEHIASADMTVPIWENPYSSKVMLDTITKMVPYEPKQPGIGFNIPINGQLDKFINTYHSDLSGRTISLQLAWDFTLSAETLEPVGDGQVDLLGLHCDDFLGDVFLCKDSVTGDLLRTRMYTTTDYVLDWLIQHPTAMDECEIIIRYSPFGNYPDYISSIKNGVMVGVTQGGGKGRIVDAQMWIPGL